MRIGIVSDLHGNLAGWERAWELLGDSEVLFVGGDLLYHGPRFDPVASYNPRALAEALSNCPVPLLICRGNADSEVDTLFVKHPIQSPYVFAMLEGKRFLLTHGHLEAPEKLLEQARQWGIDYLINGHFHVPHVTRHEGLVHLNPGTPTYPLAQDERLCRPTCARIVDGVAEILDLETGEALEVG